MPRFLFQPDPIDGYDFNPIPIDIHLGIIKIPNKEILDDDAINNTESVIVGTDRKEVLNRIKIAFAREFERYGKLSQIFDLWIMKQGKHGQELENILKI